MSEQDPPTSAVLQEAPEDSHPETQAARRALLLGHISDDLAEAREVRTSLGHGSVPTALRVAGLELRTRIEQLEQELAALADYTRTADASRPDWDAMLAMRRRLRRLTRESLALLASAFLRGSNLDHEVSGTTDDTIQILSSWCGLQWKGAVLHGDAYFHDRTADLIRMRYPAYSIADLPLALHELGHKVVVELRYRDPEAGEGSPLSRLADVQTPAILPGGYAAGLPEAESRAIGSVHARELLCDAFAMFSGGQAYAHSVLRLVTPGNLLVTTRSHPSWTDRLYFIRRMVLLLDSGDVGGTASEVVRKWIAPPWAAIACAAGAVPPAEGSVEVLDALAEAAVHELTRNTDPRLRYRHDAGNVTAIATYLADPTGGVAPAGDWTVRQVVAAVWHWRLRNPADTQERRSIIDRRAAALSRQRVRRGRSD